MALDLPPELRKNPDVMADFMRTKCRDPLYTDTCAQIAAVLFQDHENDTISTRTTSVLRKSGQVHVLQKSSNGTDYDVSLQAQRISTDEKTRLVKVVLQCREGESATGAYSLILAPGQEEKIKCGLWTVSYNGNTVIVS